MIKNFFSICRRATVICLLPASVAYSQTATFSPSAQYVTNGVTVTLNDNYTLVLSNANVSYVSYTFTNGLNAFSVSPLITNGIVRIKNTSPSTNNYISVGGVGSSNNFLIYPGEVFQGRVNNTILYGSSSNGTQTAAILWLPN